jgi:hypothetical protein
VRGDGSTGLTAAYGFCLVVFEEKLMFFAGDAVRMRNWRIVPLARGPEPGKSMLDSTGKAF